MSGASKSEKYYGEVEAVLAGLPAEDGGAAVLYSSQRLFQYLDVLKSMNG